MHLDACFFGSGDFAEDYSQNPGFSWGTVAERLSYSNTEKERPDRYPDPQITTQFSFKEGEITSRRLPEKSRVERCLSRKSVQVLSAICR